MYQNVYRHKTTRGIEKLFGFIILRLHKLINEDSKDTGLPRNHPIYRFLLNPDSVERALSLDDNVFFGSLPFLREAKDKIISDCARRLMDGSLLLCVDIRRRVEGQFPIPGGADNDSLREREAKLQLKIKEVMSKVTEYATKSREDNLHILVDEYKRPFI
jgi:hypothetical protein